VRQQKINIILRLLDRTIEASGFAAMLGFNLHQLMRNLAGLVKPKAV